MVRREFVQLCLHALIIESAWHQGRTSRGSSSKESSRGLKWFVDLTGTGATKTVSGVWGGLFLTTNLVLPTQQAPYLLEHGAVHLQSVSPSTTHNNILTSRLINP